MNGGANGRVRMATLVLVATLATAGTGLAATAARPKKGATYSGTIKRNHVAIRFRVSQTGQSVGHFKIEYAPFIFCQGGGATMRSRAAHVSSNGTFRARLPIQDINGQSGGHVTVTGAFAKGGKEAGKVTVAINDAPPGSGCNRSSLYSTKAG